MITKIWIGDNDEKRQAVMALFDIEKFGGANYFRNCTAIYVYNKGAFDVRVSNNKDKKFFKQHNGIEIIMEL